MALSPANTAEILVDALLRNVFMNKNRGQIEPM
ncbi:hypothetical protein PF001_g1419 [Phytophthora fragariae]|uniref:Uncharacterized protein n=1 Tax=Phytophthora fragariae TaxID=53985 RepID=A0A6A3HK37_9STRA|nr:hypothetical protein PF003_g18717 [Phytophthora fragariae]KAE8968478.1 hypothetical protein PF011_g27166 [Phytophthora fragariae]KAE9078224.1 hypothetical protein PF006_g27758 [Phytophthora fragariae]KAE9328437.1 hypothetical protein PF001_g1419 [Phytophthora fragariae]